LKDFRDRQPTKPGRRKLTYADGTEEYVTLEMADAPTELGTPLNREAFMALQGFTSEDTTISEDGETTTITTSHADGGASTAVITQESETITKIIITYTGPGGLTNKEEITIDTSGENIQIGGVAT
jgi:hypothetical protein